MCCPQSHRRQPGARSRQTLWNSSRGARCGRREPSWAPTASPASSPRGRPRRRSPCPSGPVGVGVAGAGSCFRECQRETPVCRNPP